MAATILEMARYRFPAFINASTPRYVVVWDIHWHVMACQRLEPATDLSGAMAATIERLTDEGWQAEATPEYGFVFIRRGDDANCSGGRRLEYNRADTLSDRRAQK